MQNVCTLTTKRMRKLSSLIIRDLRYKKDMLHRACIFFSQYTFVVPKPETEIMISLLQKDVRDQRGLKATPTNEAKKREMTGMGQNFSIGFFVMKVRVYLLLHDC